jgi:protein-S-isoprenylcysteine O-methyltransferase Ste14
MSLVRALFGVTLVLEGLLGGGLIVSLLRPAHRVWPPPRRGSWQYWYLHLSTESAITGFLVLGVVDGRPFVSTPGLRAGVAILLVVVGAALFLWAIRTLSLRTSLGVPGTLITSGPYRYSRNPQYVGAVVLFSGLILLFNSFYATVTGIIGNGWFLLMPFVEEPWLRDQYRAAYDDYCSRVPRFL